jgi:hypothetical protein
VRRRRGQPDRTADTGLRRVIDDAVPLGQALSSLSPLERAIVVRRFACPLLVQCPQDRLGSICSPARSCTTIWSRENLSAYEVDTVMNSS